MLEHLDAKRRAIISGIVALAFAPARVFADSKAIEGQVFEGTRPDDALGGEGGEGLRAKSGQDIRRSSFTRLGNGAIRINKPTDRLLVEHCKADLVYRFLENTASKRVSDASLTNFAIKQVVARNLVRGFSRVRYASSNGLFEDIIAHAADSTAEFCSGFTLDGTASNITYRRCEASGFRGPETDDTRYWNGDGFTDERGNHDITYINCTAKGCSDGGFDTKSHHVLLEGCTAVQNKRNFRLWNTGTLTGCRSENPIRYGGVGGPAHIALMGDAPRYQLNDLVVTASADNAAPVFYCETKQPALIEIRNACIDAPAAALIKVAGPAPDIRWIGGRGASRVNVGSAR